MGKREGGGGEERESRKEERVDKGRESAREKGGADRRLGQPLAPGHNRPPGYKGRAGKGSHTIS